MAASAIIRENPGEIGVDQYFSGRLMRIQRCPTARCAKSSNRRRSRLDPGVAIGFDDGRTSQNSRLMPCPLAIDPALFDPAAVSTETRAVNEEIVRRLDAEPVGLTIPEIRARRIAGVGA